MARYSHAWLVRKMESRRVACTSGLSVWLVTRTSSGLSGRLQVDCFWHEQWLVRKMKVEVLLLARLACPSDSLHKWLVRKIKGRSVTRTSGLSEWLVWKIESKSVTRTSVLSRSCYLHEWLARKLESRSVTCTSGLSRSCYSHEWLF